MKWLRLQLQLRREAVDAREAADLSALAKRISKVEVPLLSTDAKSRIAAELGLSLRSSTPPWLLMAGSVAAVLLIAVVTLAQYSRPGSTLYSLKHQTDRIIELVRPDASKSTTNEPDDKGSSDSSIDKHNSTSDDRKGKSSTPSPSNTSSDDQNQTQIQDSSGSGSGSSGSGTSGSSGSNGSNSGSGDGGTSGGHGGSSGKDSPSDSK